MLRKISDRLKHPQNPLLVVQGVWLEENESGRDLFEQSASFSQEIREAVSAVHGDIEIDQRFGKAHGKFVSYISPWVIAYLPGREIFPGEVAVTNASNSGVNNFSGAFFQLSEADPIEVWLSQRLDSLMIYEHEHYGEVRPTGFSSWPTLDPLTHPTEQDVEESEEDDDRAFSTLVPVYLKVGYPLGSDPAFTQVLSSVFPNPGGLSF